MQVYFEWIKQNIDTLNPENSVEVFNNVVILLNYLSQANIEEKCLDLDSKHMALPEEVHLLGMTIFSKSSKHFDNSKNNTCSKNKVHKNKTILSFSLISRCLHTIQNN